VGGTESGSLHDVQPQQRPASDLRVRDSAPCAGMGRGESCVSPAVRRRETRRGRGAARERLPFMPSSDKVRGAPPPAKRPLNPALQGGGSHGAFAWGVIDRLLEHDAIEIEGVVGTSAGAMNAAVMAYGLAIGGKTGARAKLREFWQAISEAARMSPLQQ